MSDVVLKPAKKRRDKGSGTLKYGRNARTTHGRGGNHKANSAEYRAREMRGQTAKVKRVTRALLSGVKQTNWFLNSNAQKEG